MDRSDLERFYAKNAGLIHAVARKGYSRLQALESGLDYEDVFQAMAEIFIKSYDLFDESSGNKFSTYFVRAAYNGLNKIAEKIEIERVINKTRSIEALSDSSDAEGDRDMAEVIPSHDATPEQVAEMESAIEEMFGNLSPVAAMIVEMTVNPPSFIEREFVAAQAFAERARAIGFNRRASKSLNLTFVCSVMESIGAIPPLTVREARKEIIEAVKREISE